jgi:flagellar biosynthesis/type III secretory pathway chaperone
MQVETWNPETVAPGEAALPVLLPDAGGEAALMATGAVRSDEVRGLLAAIRRLESVVEEETAVLETGKKIDLDDFSARKSRSMLEFVHLMRARIHLGGEAQVTDEIQRLRQKLEKNRAVLEMHYEAVREVAAIIVRAIREAESDGTYSATASQKSK